MSAVFHIRSYTDSDAEALAQIYLRAVRQTGPRHYTPAQVAAWSPIQWACVGYADLALAGAWPHRGLRRLVRLALPARWPVPDGRHQAPVRHACALEGLTRLDALFAKEPT